MSSVASKACRKCGESKPYSEFNKGNDRFGLHTWCKSCVAHYKKEWRKADGNGAREAATSRRHYYKATYGISVDDYERMLEEQFFECPICGKDVDDEGSMFSVDHNHTTGVIRGLLCRQCNRALGMFSDSADVLRRAITYLENEDNK